MKLLTEIREDSPAGENDSQEGGFSIVRQKEKSQIKRTISLIGQFTARIGLSERRKDARVPPRNLTASYWMGLERKQVKIKDISYTGIYLITGDRWSPGESLLLTLHGNDRKHGDSMPQVRFAAKVARMGHDGVGLTFVPEFIDVVDWLTVVSKATTLTSEDRGIRVFRMSLALAFLRRVSPVAEDKILKAITQGLNPERAEKALEIILRAHDILASQNATPSTGVSPDLILQILHEGSITNDQRVQRCWSGLLASSSVEGANENANFGLAVLLSKLDPVHIHTLSAACEKEMPTGGASRTIAIQPVPDSRDEWENTSGVRDIAEIECVLNRLSEIGLLDPSVKSSGQAPIQHAGLTPTSLGLELWTACNGTLDRTEQNIVRRLIPGRETNGCRSKPNLL